MEAWVFFSGLMTVGKAVGALVNEYFKVKALHLLFWMRTVVLLGLIPLPLVFDLPLPHDWVFFAVLIVASLLVPYADILYIGLTARSGAGVVTRILPLVTAMIFVMWLPFSPDLVMDYIGRPFRFAGIVAAVGGSIYFAMKLRHCAISFDALKKLMPAMLLWSMATVMGKFAIGRVEGPANVYYYLLIQCVVVWLAYFLMVRIKAFDRYVPHMDLESSLFQKNAIIAGVVSGFVWLMATGSRWFAIDDVENPAYVSVIGLTAPFLVMLVYKLVGRKENAHVWAGLGIVFCAGLLVFFTKI